MEGILEKGTEPGGLSERPQEAGGDKSVGGPPARRFSAKRKAGGGEPAAAGRASGAAGTGAQRHGGAVVGVAGSGFVGRRGGVEGARARRPRRRDRAAEGEGRRDDHGDRAVA